MPLSSYYVGVQGYSPLAPGPPLIGPRSLLVSGMDLVFTKNGKHI